MCTSEKSFQDAVRIGIERATQSLRNVRGAWVKEQEVTIQDGKIVAFQVFMKVTFELDKCHATTPVAVPRSGRGSGQRPRRLNLVVHPGRFRCRGRPRGGGRDQMITGLGCCHRHASGIELFPTEVHHRRYRDPNPRRTGHCGRAAPHAHRRTDRLAVHDLRHVDVASAAHRCALGATSHRPDVRAAAGPSLLSAPCRRCVRSC